ncbi:amino acid permease-domain-containing protein [Trichophaea hybrida]|nr:amino acid permease-domain-containing protein [Trichophaea hybrida]
MFLRFGFILGQSGNYVINLITTLSVSAISSNGTVRGGGAYFLISRSLGPEFGGSIGLVFYLGFVFNTGMNAVGLIDCVINNFGEISGTMSQVVPESFWHRYLYATAVLVFCTVVCLAGENWQTLFGILFPATAGIFAGASMSGDLKNPSKSIPAGTLYGLLFTFISYTLVIVSMGATISRDTLYTNLNVIQDINASPPLVLMGEFATSFFSALMGVIGSAKSLQALARDNIFPGLTVFGQGTKSSDDPTIAILFTFLLSQFTLFMDINSIASFVTMTYLITFWVTNFACFLLKIGSAPNFRPTFKFFTWWTAAIGAMISLATMFFVDGTYAAAVIGIILTLFLIIHYTSPPKTWGDVSQSLIYHQVRKYLLRLRTEHVKFWRPQILLFVNDPRRSWKMIQFCNAMKKGGLYVLGHIIVTTEFQESFPEVRKQQTAWMKYIDFSKIKAFPQVAIAPTFEWGARNVVLSAGLGGMRPNIAVIGFFNMDEYRDSKPLIDLNIPSLSSTGTPSVRKIRHDLQDQLPTDNMRSESAVGPMSYVNILEDLLLCLQMNDDTNGNVVTTNFDTYTLILQLGCILNTVRTWKEAYILRVAVFVEYEEDVKEECDRVKKLLENLRIQAEVIVVWLASGGLRTYELIVNGADQDQSDDGRLERILGEELWWKELQERRHSLKGTTPSVQIRGVSDLDMSWPSSSFQQMGRSEMSRSPIRRLGLRKLKNSAKRHSISGLAMLGLSVTMNMRAQRLNPDALHHGSDSEESSDDESVASSTASANDINDYSDDDRVAFDFGRPRRASTGDGLTAWDTGTPKMPAPSKSQVESIAPNAGVVSTSQDVSPSGSKLLSPAISRLRLVSRPSTPSFSCKAIPDTQISVDDGPGPSIMFADSNQSQKPRSIGHLLESIPTLSFNDLPSRGQHLILNELMKRYSSDTAVLFTTLPSPPPNSCKSEQDSMAYLEGLEV